MINIYYTYIHESIHQQLLNAYLHTFPQEFQTKVLKFRRWQDAQLSLLGRLLLRHSLQKLGKEALEQKLQYTAYNKPYFENNPLSFNISHSGNMAICAVSEHLQIGIDIEVKETINIHDFKLQMTDNEWNTIYNASQKQQAFYDYWTQKEAVIKAGGKGLSIDLKSYEIHKNKTHIEGIAYGLQKLHIDENYACHIAYKLPASEANYELLSEKINSQNIDFKTLMCSY
ncbi:4'-phosphopantetheinyl transferase [Kordia periserrulae]|uniref:4'-phosphopantetheinyl transferase n=1 Tax=Kordia periserrulae TaxID=701523 RepID=A0A2T6BZ81_9FLAO|nr:4'-phosphopantetheinyl transferase superfamily protein [Kordia periserrulae]PTX61385.1 4'-phosphopantetheinyl transferase [Kordia periserrulae]